MILNLWKWLSWDGGWVNLSTISSIFSLFFAFQNILLGIKFQRDFSYFLWNVILLIIISGFLFFIRSSFFLAIIYTVIGTGMFVGADYISDFSGLIFFIFAFKIIHTWKASIILGVLMLMSFSVRFLYMSFEFSRALELVFMLSFVCLIYFILFELPEIKKIKEKNTTTEINGNLKIIKYDLSDQELFLLNSLAKGSIYKEMAWKITNEMDHEISENGVS